MMLIGVAKNDLFKRLQATTISCYLGWGPSSIYPSSIRKFQRLSSENVKDLDCLGMINFWFWYFKSSGRKSFGQEWIGWERERVEYLAFMKRDTHRERKSKSNSPHASFMTWSESEKEKREKEEGWVAYLGNKRRGWGARVEWLLFGHTGRERREGLTNHEHLMLPKYTFRPSSPWSIFACWTKNHFIIFGTIF